MYENFLTLRPKAVRLETYCLDNRANFLPFIYLLQETICRWWIDFVTRLTGLRKCQQI